MVSRREAKYGMLTTHLPELLSFLLPLCVILILLDCAEEEVDLSDHDLGK
jgi:hypothetical protein